MRAGHRTLLPIAATPDGEAGPGENLTPAPISNLARRPTAFSLYTSRRPNMPCAHDEHAGARDQQGRVVMHHSSSDTKASDGASVAGVWSVTGTGSSGSSSTLVSAGASLGAVVDSGDKSREPQSPSTPSNEDLAVTARVTAALQAPYLRGSRLEVHTLNGVVTISGCVVDAAGDRNLRSLMSAMQSQIPQIREMDMNRIQVAG